jgi:hypothetical protein
MFMKYTSKNNKRSHSGSPANKNDLQTKMFLGKPVNVVTDQLNCLQRVFKGNTKILCP